MIGSDLISLRPWSCLLCRRPGFACHLGMVSETANRGCAFVQELQRRDDECNVAHAGSGPIQFHVLMPQLLQTLMGYTAQKAGMAVSAGALVVLVVLPMVGKLTSRFQARHLIAFGWITLAVSMYVSCKQIDLLMSFSS